MHIAIKSPKTVRAQKKPVCTLIYTDFKNFKDEENAAVENIKYKNILLKFRELLLENLDPDKVSLQLLTAGVLTSDDKEKIEENPSQREKSEELLMMLATKGPRAYKEFMKTLEESHCFLAFQLLKEGMYSVGQHEMVSVVISIFFGLCIHQ